MKNVGHRTAWEFAQRLWVAIALTVAAGCSSQAAGDLPGASGDGGNGGFAGRPIAEEVVEADDARVARTPGEESLVAPPAAATACTAGNQCSSGFCVDGFCCDTKCDYPCMACSAAKKGSGADGVCGSVAYDTDPDNDCPVGACDGKNQCKNYNGVPCISTAQCLSNYCVDGVCCGNICMGACQACTATKKGSGYDGVCGSIKVATDPDNECNPGECNGSGACNSSPQPTFANGAACTSAAQCQSGFCADGVCCDSWCLGTCLACTAAKKGGGADGTCGFIPDDKDYDDECWAGACNGAGVCKNYNGMPCTDKAQCLSNYCVDGYCCGNICTQLCWACSNGKKGYGFDGVCEPIGAGRDQESECNPGECNGSGACNQAQTPQGNGTTCVSGGQCASGNCVDGVCCDTACASNCMACTAAKKGSGANGICGFIASETDPDKECGYGRCDGKGVCRYYNGNPCTSTGQCFSNYCVDGFCCGNVCTSACMACSTAKKGYGFDGVCQNIGGGRDPDNECNPGECSGSGACNQPQSQQPNGAACTLATQCISGNCVDGVCCDNACAGNCTACTAAKKGQGTNGTCGYIITNTDPDNECANSDCNGSGGCTNPTNLPNGSACSAGTQCASMNCVDGFCCDTACNGVCQACAAIKKQSGPDGTCGPVKYDTDPDDECFIGACNGAGACGSYNGQACTTTATCLSNYCVDGFCCNNHCGGTCYACSTAKKGTGYDGVCSFIQNNTDPDNECSGAGVCNGSGVCTTATCTTNADCGSNATCSNSTCSCNTGYSGDGYTCTDVDECAVNNGGCDANATCTNTPGSRSCACNAGYSGDGITCVAIPPVQVIAANGSTTCVITNNGRMKCWGANSNGQLGLGDTNDRGDVVSELNANLPDVSLGTGLTPTHVAVGGAHTCAILTGGVVKCWGKNTNGQLGIGDTNDRGDAANEMGDNLPTVDLGTGKTATQITAGDSHTCALLNDNTVKCWGNPANGRLGQGHIMQHGDGVGPMGDGLPIVDLGSEVSAVSISTFHDSTCALLNNADVKCWGANASGQLGQGDMADRGGSATDMGDNLLPIAMGTGKTALAIATGKQFACALLNDSTVKCWGANNVGQLGQGDMSARGDGAMEMGDNLAAINLGTGKLAATLFGGMDHACVVLTDASLKCWGANGDGRLGLEDANDRGDGANEMGDLLAAINVGTGKTATSVALGNQHTCARLNDGNVKCWGFNANGQLGLGDTMSRGSMAGQMGDNLPAARLF